MLAALEKLPANVRQQVLVLKEKYVLKENVFVKEVIPEKVRGFVGTLTNVS